MFLCNIASKKNVLLHLKPRVPAVGVFDQLHRTVGHLNTIFGPGDGNLSNTFFRARVKCTKREKSTYVYHKQP